MSYRVFLRPLKRGVADALESLWLRVFEALALLRRPTAVSWSSPGHQKVLVVAPHPDDEAMGCAGTLLLHAQRGDPVCVVIATDGRRSRVLDDPDVMAAQRRVEAVNAAAAMGVGRLEWLGLAEGEWQVSDLDSQLRTLIRQVNPDVIYAPSRLDFHPEHFKVAHALALALHDSHPDCHAGRRVRIYQVQVPLTRALCNLVADVSAVWERTAAALRAYESQQGSVFCAHRMRRYTARQQRAGHNAEAFWDMPAACYRALHDTPMSPWPAVFRGVRHFPLTDPWAYVAGRVERRRLKAGVKAEVTAGVMADVACGGQ